MSRERPADRGVQQKRGLPRAALAIELDHVAASEPAAVGSAVADARGSPGDERGRPSYGAADGSRYR